MRWVCEPAGAAYEGIASDPTRETNEIVTGRAEKSLSFVMPVRLHHNCQERRYLAFRQTAHSRIKSPIEDGAPDRSLE